MEIEAIIIVYFAKLRNLCWGWRGVTVYPSLKHNFKDTNIRDIMVFEAASLSVVVRLHVNK